MTEPEFKILPIPVSRRSVVDAGRYGVRRHTIYGLFELDVTLPRRMISEVQAASGERLSFTAFMVGCLARAVEQHPKSAAYRDWRNRLYIFSDVDVVTLVETEAGGVALPHIIRSANRRSVRQISEEIRSVQADHSRSAQSSGIGNWGLYLPRFLRDLAFWYLRSNPPRFKRMAGTTLVTSVGMFASGGFWGISFLPWHTSALTLGGMAEKPAVVDGQIVVREFLSATLSFDHDIFDGAPAARFANTFKELVESAYGL